MKCSSITRLELLERQCLCNLMFKIILDNNTVKAPISENPREAKKVSATGAGRLRECINTEFCQGGRNK